MSTFIRSLKVKMSTFINPKIVLNGLTFLLDAANKKSYSGSGSVWTDLSKNKNNGVLTNPINIVHEPGSHLRFNESNTAGTGYIEMGNVLTSTYTKNVWFRTNANNANNLLSGAPANTSTILWSDQRYIAAGHGFAFNINNGATVQYDSGSTLGLQSWHNVCVTYVSTTMKLYVNGILVDTGTAPVPNEFSLHIGAAANQYELSGDVAYASLYNRALTAAEVLQNYNAIKGRFVLNTANTPATYAATPASSSVNEGSSLTINVATTFVSNGTTLYFLNSRPSDFPSSSDSGNFTINNNAGSFTVTPTADSNTESGVETFYIMIKTGSTSGTTVTQTSSITINDTSGGTYVCTASHANNLITDLDFKTLKKYGIKLRRNDKYLMKGYDWFGPKLAASVKKGKLVNFAKHSTSLWKYDYIKQKDASFNIKLMIKVHKLFTRPIIRMLGVLLTVKEKIKK